MKPFYGIGIDKLTLCYTINKNSILHNIGDEVEIDLGDFRLRKIESGHFKNSFHILSLWDAPDNKGLSWQIYGTLKFARYTDKEEMPTLAWLYFENKTLYQQMYPQVNTIVFAEYQADALGLELRNITNLEIVIISPPRYRP